MMYNYLTKIAKPKNYFEAYLNYVKTEWNSISFENYLEDELRTRYEKYVVDNCPISLENFITQINNGTIRYCEDKDGIYYINDWEVCLILKKL